MCLLTLQDDEEDDEDIDNLVSIHRKTVGSSTSNLRGSKVNACDSHLSYFHMF